MDTLLTDKRLKTANIAKVVLMLLIVLYHSLLFLNGKWFTAATIEYQVVPSYICEWINSFAIYAFTFISGYIFCYQKNEKGSYQKYGSFVVTKVKRLVVPFVFLLFIWVVPIDILVNGWNIDKFIHSYILCELPDQLWFLLMLFLVFVLSWPLTNVYKKKWGVLLPLVFFGLSYVGSRYIANYYQVWTALRFVIFFYLGYMTRFKLSDYIKKVPFWIWLLINVALFVGLVFIDKGDGPIFTLLSIFVSFILNCVGAIMVWSIFDFINNKTKFADSRFITFLSSKTMVIYMIHQQVICVCILLLCDKINLYLLALINFIVSMLISIGVSLVVLRFNPTRFLFGEKTSKQFNLIKR